MTHWIKYTFMFTTLAGWILTAAAPVKGEGHEKTLSEKIAGTDWTKLRGVNYIPSYGRNMYENWRDYDPDAFDMELALASKVGYNSVRLWLNYFVFAEQGSRAVDSVEDAVRLCRKHGLKALITLFDGCGILPRPDERRMTILEAYDHYLASPPSPHHPVAALATQPGI
jgi:hypothetical protein